MQALRAAAASQIPGSQDDTACMAQTALDGLDMQ